MVMGHSDLSDLLRELLETDGCFEVLSIARHGGHDEVDIVILAPEVNEDPFLLILIDDSSRGARVHQSNRVVEKPAP